MIGSQESYGTAKRRVLVFISCNEVLRYEVRAIADRSASASIIGACIIEKGIRLAGTAPQESGSLAAMSAVSLMQSGQIEPQTDALLTAVH